MPLQLWTDVLKLRPEVIAADGGIGDLQMSLHKAVYQTAAAPYRDIFYYDDITEPTPNIVGFFARIARRLSAAAESVALYHLDQGMGGGKSHALVGLYHMTHDPKTFFATHIGQKVYSEASSGGSKIAFDDARVVTLTADHFSPGKATETFGPAMTLFERFLWSLFDGDHALYDAAVNQGPNKATIQKALACVDRPVLILLDELMDYAMALSSAQAIAGMPEEQAFLNALMDACDDVPRVAFVLVMIRTEQDPEGYTPAAEQFRQYLAARITRNGATIAVTETGDFAAIIRRRIFEQAPFHDAANDVTKCFQQTISTDQGWETQVFARLGTGKGSATLTDRINSSYPFHPDLMDLVQNEWGKTQGFQRVRSTVSIFALAALHWTQCAKQNKWAPPLIGVGDLPLGGINAGDSTVAARCLEALLNSGLLLGNDRAIQGYRAVATTDITSADGASGQAVEVDRKLVPMNLKQEQPAPAIRMATALFNYSLVARSQGKRGATKAELMAALFLPYGYGASPFSSIEEVFTALTSPDGLGALEVSRPANNQPERYWLTIKQTLRMFFNSASAQVHEEQSLDLLWKRAEELASKGPFDTAACIDRPEKGQDLGAVVGKYDSEENRLFVMDPRLWTLLNGEDSRSRSDIKRIFGIAPDALIVENAASCVVATVNTYNRRQAVRAAQDVLTWEIVASQVEDEELNKVNAELAEAGKRLSETTRKAYRHYAYLTRRGDKMEVVFAKFDDDKQTSLNGNDIWNALVAGNHAVGPYMDPVEKRPKKKVLSEEYVAFLLDGFSRHLTLRDIVSSFYKNPRFPRVPHIDDIRDVVFKLVQPEGHAGESTGGWEMVSPDGSVLHAQNPGEIAISSSKIQLRRVALNAAAPQPDTTTADREDATPEPKDASALVSPIPPGGSQPEAPKANDGHAKAESYAWYRFEISNRPISDEAKRDEIVKHLQWLRSQIQGSAIDPQLISLKYDLLAGRDPDLIDQLEDRANALQAKSRVDDEI